MSALRSAFAARQRGFTLVELMITVAIVGILAMIAYPSYTSYLQKGRRAEGKAALMDDMQLFERHFAQINTYAQGLGATDIRTPWQGFKGYSGDSQSVSNYDIAALPCTDISSIPDQCVELQASPRKGDPACGVLVYRSTGEKKNILPGATTATSPPTPGCW